MLFTKGDFTKMASHESSEDSIKSPIAARVNNTTAQSKTDEKKSPAASPPIDRYNELSDSPVDAKKRKKSTSDVTTDDCASVQKNKFDIKSENKEDLKPLLIDKNKQDDSKTDVKQTTQDLASLADPQDTNEEKEVKSEGSKVSTTKGGSALKRKRKTLRLVPTYF